MLGRGKAQICKGIGVPPAWGLMEELIGEKTVRGREEWKPSEMLAGRHGDILLFTRLCTHRHTHTRITHICHCGESSGNILYIQSTKLASVQLFSWISICLEETTQSMRRSWDNTWIFKCTIMYIYCIKFSPLLPSGCLCQHINHPASRTQFWDP